MEKLREKEYPMTLKRVTDRWNESAFLREVYQRWYEDLITSLQIKETDKVLEIGCGVGFFAEYLKKKFPKLDYTGVDYVPEAVRLAKKRVRNAKFIAADFQKATGKYDKIFCIDVIHHIEQKKFFRKVHSLLKKGAMFGAIEPNPGVSLLVSYRIFGFHEIVSEYPTSGKLKEEAEKQGFTVKALSYSNAIDYPLSGGFSGKNLVVSRWLVNGFDDIFSSFKSLCWKFKIILVRN